MIALLDAKYAGRNKKVLFPCLSAAWHWTLQGAEGADQELQARNCSM
jgi:hypothetical protein